MRVEVTGPAFDTGVSIKNHIEEKLQSTLKKFKKGQVHKIHAVLSKDGIDFLCRIDVAEEIGGKTIIHASHRATEAYPCVDGAIKKLEETMIRYKEKILKERNYEGAILRNKTPEINKLEIVDEVYEILGETEADDEEKLLK